MSRADSGYPSTGLVDLLRLLGRCVGSFASSPSSFDLSASLQDGIEELVVRTGSENFILNLYFGKLLVVTGRELSGHILAQPPMSGDTWKEGPRRGRWRFSRRGR